MEAREERPVAFRFLGARRRRRAFDGTRVREQTAAAPGAFGEVGDPERRDGCAIPWEPLGRIGHLRASDLLVFGPKGPIDNALRHADEPARHKILDVVGDLSLFGLDLAGHVVAYRSGHPLNVELARALTGRLAQTQPPTRQAA